MSNYALISIIICYLAILFYIAFYAEKNAKSKWVNNPFVYTLSLAVYCSAWTYYGSVGIAANSGISFLPIYLGPVIATPLWIVVLRKIIRISKQHKISSIADFVSLRYGNNRFLGALITVICVFGIVPYISLQLKAISETFEIMTYETSYMSTNIFDDSTFYIAVLLALFATFFGTQTSDASEKHRGIVVSVAFESILKLLFFLIIGIYVTYFLFDGTSDIYNKISLTPNFESLTKINGLEAGFDWFFMMMISFIAIFLLPRQFQLSVIENTREKYLKQAIWMFPLYLLLFNIFVIFIAWGGKLSFGNSVNAEYFTLLLPLQNNHVFLALLVFLGGFSAVISMVVVSTLALSTMVSNNLIIPYGFLDKFIKGQPEKNSKYIKNIRRISIFIIIITAYIFYINFSIELSLYSIGLMSFVIISQLAPSFFVGLFWNRGSSKASIIGILVGFFITVYTLVLPFTIEAFTGIHDFTDHGLFNIAALKPYALFGIDFLSPPAHAFFWSMSANVLCYLIFSLTSKGNYRERNYAEMFVDSRNYSSLQDSALVWKGEAYVSDIKNVLNKFLGEERAQRALNLFFLKYKIPPNTQMADARLINFSEKLLTGSIGSASAKILIASVVKEEQISLIEVLKILEESKETIANNKILREKSEELSNLALKLKQANEELISKDKQKDEFLDTVAHELKTPITGIRASTELLMDEDNDMPSEIKAQFLSNMLNDSDRLSRLINNILDFEKLSKGKHELNIKQNNIKITIKQAISSVQQLAINKGIAIINDNLVDFVFSYDEDRIVQVLTNLLSNALKFTEPNKGKITIEYKMINNFVEVYVIDNGKGIPDEDFEYIFDKFYQSKNQNTIKPHGSGLGLAICKQILEQHHGKIWAKKSNKNGATFVFKLPFM
ncbi:MAG: sodium:proline symporter [Flavobacteriales bacterium]|nr:sodium:proline symporter [Flavobacteriales bacterium]PIV94162.1 MAG: sodium:proline symporter [Flavobacteriaceae bacterium CG17_big_fil_post_rev_8_21_14_2_50_33_15]PIY09601.1 MAG: sodium:proline symporter [Flavobacteriaceae bacterium CG_4_10_14_3_um_filter_33_47]PJB17366.1 MAG: sodium:proline symporter [Flavobacteriaceae bacterium CG_4_9_14_3_um_filter_33_16]NCQ58229.1 sodium:proline symporter [Flavobacteriales bacterium]